MQYIQKKKKEQNSHVSWQCSTCKKRTNNAHFKKIHSSEPAKTQLSNCACLYNKDVAVEMKKKIFRLKQEHRMRVPTLGCSLTLKIRSRSPNSFLHGDPPNCAKYQTWPESIQWFWRYSSETHFLNDQSSVVTLKIRSRSPNSFLQWRPSQLC